MGPASRRPTQGPRRPPPPPPCRRWGQVPAPGPAGSARRGRTPQALATAGRPPPPGWPAGAQRRRGQPGRPRWPVRTRQHHRAAHAQTLARQRPRPSTAGRRRGRRPSVAGTDARRDRPPTTRPGPCPHAVMAAGPRRPPEPGTAGQPGPSETSRSAGRLLPPRTVPRRRRQREASRPGHAAPERACSSSRRLVPARPHALSRRPRGVHAHGWPASSQPRHPRR